MVERSIAVLENPPRLELEPSGNEAVSITAGIPLLADSEHEKSFCDFFRQQIIENCAQYDCAAEVYFDSKRRFMAMEIRQIVSAALRFPNMFCPRTGPGGQGDREPLNPIPPRSELGEKVPLPV
jgi:hypothetical protein